MTNPDTVTFVAELYTVRRTKTDAEKREKELVALVGPAADTAIAALSLPEGAPQACVFGGFKVLRVPGVNSRVDAQALLDHGIAPDVIADCTKRSEYQSYRISPVKEQTVQEDGYDERHRKYGWDR